MLASTQPVSASQILPSPPMLPRSKRRCMELDAAQHENDALYARWAELTEKSS